jgi:hypothetical protein
VAKTSFGPNDDRAYLWVEVVNAAVGDTVQWRWFAPNGSPYATSQYTFTFAGNGCAWAWIDISGQPAATLLGKWRSDVYLNGALAVGAEFSIGTTPGPAPTVGVGAAHLEFPVSDQFLVPWGYVRLSYRIKSFQPGLRADLHLALLVEGEGSECVGPDLVFASGLPAFATDLALSDMQGVVIERQLPAHMSPVVSTLYGVLVARGMSAADPENWISNLAALDLQLGTLSRRQHELLAKRGHPSAFRIEFDHTAERRLETWTYRGGGLGQVFHFENGRPLRAGEDEEKRRSSSPAGARSGTLYSPGRFSPTTSVQEIRALVGDPDHVLPGSRPGVQQWVYDEARITVTLSGGTISAIEAY